MARSGGISGHSPSRILENITPWHLKAQTRYAPFYVMEVTHDARHMMPIPKKLQAARRHAIALTPKQREKLIERWERKQFEKQQSALERIVRDQQIETASMVLLARMNQPV